MVSMAGKMIIYTKSTGNVSALVSFDKNPKTAKAITSSLPIKARASRWGDEIYFRIPVSLNEENSQEEVEIGDLGYWPPGNGFCIFFGRTPASTGNKPKAASPVNVFGKIIGEATVFSKVRDGEEVWIKKA
jgi:hypothetical protein